MKTFLARFALSALLVFSAYMALVGYTHAVYERGWDDGIEYAESLDEEWPEPQPEIET
jgi:hypothetical protein